MWRACSLVRNVSHKGKIVEAPTLWVKMARPMLWNVEEEWKEQMVFRAQSEPDNRRQVCSFMRADYCWILSHKKNMEKHMVADGKRNPKAASHWWTSTSGKKKDMVIETSSRRHILPLADDFTILEHLFSRDGRMQISLEQRMQSANKAWWRDAKKYRCKSVPWKVKCQRVFGRVRSVICVGCEI